MKPPLPTILALALLLGLPAVCASADDAPEVAVASPTVEAPPSPDAAPNAAPAEESAELEVEETPPLVLKTRELIGQLEGGVERLDGLRSEAKGAEGEDLEVLDRQIAETKLAYLEVLGKLVEHLPELDEEGLDSAEAREVLEDILSRLGPSIVEHVDEAVTNLRDMRKKRSSIDVAELPALEQSINREVEWLASIFAAYTNQVQHMATLGLDNSVLARDLANRLANRADRLLGRTQLMDEQLKQLLSRGENAPEDAALQQEIELTKARKKTLTTALFQVVDLMDASGLESSEYRQFLIRTTGKVTVDVFRGRVLTSLLDQWTRELREHALERGPSLLAKIVVFLLILLIFRLLASLTQKLTASAMGRSTANISQLQRSMLLSLANRGVMTIGLLVGFSQLGIELGPLLAGLGIAGFIVGFALQDSLANFASGVMILGYRPFDVDDFIEAGGVRGTVSHMSLVSTTILTFDNQTLIVPNSKIWGDVIKNITNQDKRRVDMSFHVSYEDDMEQAERTFQAICEDHPKILSKPEPLIKVHALGKSSIEFAVRPWVLTADYWEVYWDITREVRLRFVAEGLTTPIPRQDIRIETSKS